MTSLGVCITLSLAYSLGSWLMGWVAGAPGGLGQVTLMEVRWAPAWAPEWLPRLLVALLIVGIGVLYLWYFSRLGWWAGWVGERFGQLGRRVLEDTSDTVFTG
jgi:hypothetical protein